MTDSEKIIMDQCIKLDKVLRLHKIRLSRHVEEKEWDDLANEIERTDRNASAFQIYDSKLKRDGLIEADSNGDWMASAEGRFYSYTRKYQNEIVESNRVENLEKFQKAYANRMIYLTIVLAVAGLIACVWYGIEIYKFWYSLKYGIA